MRSRWYKSIGQMVKEQEESKGGKATTRVAFGDGSLSTSLRRGEAVLPPAVAPEAQSDKLTFADPGRREEEDRWRANRAAMVI